MFVLAASSILPGEAIHFKFGYRCEALMWDGYGEAHKADEMGDREGPVAIEDIDCFDIPIITVIRLVICP